MSNNYLQKMSGKSQYEMFEKNYGTLHLGTFIPENEGSRVGTFVHRKTELSFPCYPSDDKQQKMLFYKMVYR